MCIRDSSQSLHAWFAHVPGLKVVMPTTPADAKGLMLSAIFDDTPVVYLDHRWLHNARGHVPDGDYRVAIGQAEVVRAGSDVTLVGMSNMTIEALHAADHLAERGISCDVIDLRTINPLDWKTVFESVGKTKRLIALDSGWATGSVAGEIVARVALTMGDQLKCNPGRIALPDVPTPTSPALTRGFYPGAEDIVRMIGGMFARDLQPERVAVKHGGMHDVPGEWFKGPF